MERYGNASRKSGVYGFEIGNDYIRVQFTGSAQSYTYSYIKAGSTHIERMKVLARSGSGLNAYINQHVKYLYD